MEDNGLWFPTFSGKKIFCDDVKAVDIVLDDIAHHLAGVNRWSGATVRPMNVAEHSVRLSFVVPTRVASLALMHDGHEYVTGDMPRPVKRWLGDRIIDLEHRLDRAIYTRFDLTKLVNTPEAKDMWECDAAFPVAEALHAGLMQHTDHIPLLNGHGDNGQKGQDFARFLFDQSNIGVAVLAKLSNIDYVTNGVRWGWSAHTSEKMFLARAHQLGLT